MTGAGVTVQGVPLVAVPAVIAAAHNFLHLLPRGLPNVRQPEIPAHPVEAVAPRIAQSISPHPVVSSHADERVVRRDRVRILPGHVDSQDGAQEVGVVLSRR